MLEILKLLGGLAKAFFRLFRYSIILFTISLFASILFIYTSENFTLIYFSLAICAHLCAYIVLRCLSYFGKRYSILIEVILSIIAFALLVLYTNNIYIYNYNPILDFYLPMLMINWLVSSIGWAILFFINFIKIKLKLSSKRTIVKLKDDIEYSIAKEYKDYEKIALLRDEKDNIDVLYYSQGSFKKLFTTRNYEYVCAIFKF